jgi:hypothetical protein
MIVVHPHAFGIAVFFALMVIIPVANSSEWGSWLRYLGAFISSVAAVQAALS